MKISGQLYALAALLLGKEQHHTMKRRLVGPTHSLGIRVGKKILPLPGIESQTIQDMG